MAKMGFCRAAGSAGREADIHSVNCSYTYLPARPSTLDKPLNTNILCKVSYNKYSCQHWTNIHSVNCSYTYLPARLSTLDKHFLHSCTPTLYYHTKKCSYTYLPPFLVNIGQTFLAQLNTNIILSYKKTKNAVREGVKKTFLLF